MSDELLAEHAILRRMSPHDRTVALITAAIDSETGALRQAEALAIITAAIGQHLSEPDRRRLAAIMIDLAVKLIVRWH
jgi:hypothetical protein